MSNVGWQCLPEPSNDHHLELAEMYFDMCKSCHSQKQLVVISLFYALPHFCQAKLIALNLNKLPRTHQLRLKAIKQHLDERYTALSSLFFKLKQKSEMARYCPTIALSWNDDGDIDIFIKINQEYLEKLILG